MKKWLIRVALGMFVLLALVAALSYFWLPGFIQKQAASAVEKELGRKFTLGELHINPFTLAVQAKNLTLFEQDGSTPFLRVNEVAAKASWASVRHLAPVVDRLLVDGAQVAVVRTGETSFNFSDIQAKLAAKPPSDPAKFALYNIQIQNTSLALDDRVVKQSHTVKAIHLSVPFISSLPHDVHVFVKPSFSALIDGTPMGLEGQSKPFDGSHESALRLSLKDVNLVPWLAYNPAALPFTVRSAELADLHVNVMFNQASPRPLELQGSLGLRKIVLTEKNSATSAISLASLTLHDFNVAPLQQSFKANVLKLTGLNVAATADAQGGINLQKMFDFSSGKLATAPAPILTPAPTKPTSWQAQLAKFELVDSNVQFDDARYQPSFSVRANHVSLTSNVLQTTLYPPENVLKPAGDATSIRPMQWPLSAGETIRSTLTAQLFIGKTVKTAAKLNVQADVDAKNAVQAAVQLDGLALEALAPVLAQNKVALDLAGLASLKAALTYSAKGELNAPQAALSIANLRVGLPQSAAPLTVQKATLQLKNSTLWPAQALIADLALNFANQSYAKAAGTVSLPAGAPLTGALKLDVSQLDALPLLALAPQALSALNVRPSSGFVSALGELTVRGSSVQWAGNAALDKVQVQDADAQDLLKLGKFSAIGMRVDTAAQPMSVHLGAMTLQEGFAKLLLSAQGKLNVTGLLKPAAAEAQPAAPSSNPAPSISLDGLTIVNTAVDFNDQFIKPNYQANLSQLTGSVGAMSSINPQPAEVALKGAIEGSGDITISGKLNPLGATLYTDITAKATGIELTQLSPYSAKYADYNIVKGKLSAQVNYLIDQGKLTASNKIKIDQLTFGDAKVGSADATKLPVKLAVALLKDRKGVIEVDLPISGSLNDPKFSVGSLIWQVLGNLVVKAVTSPFALLGSLFGGGETLSYLDFAPGTVTLDAAGKKKLDALVKALNDRPALKLDIIGRADAAVDTEGLREVWFLEQIRKAKIKALLKQNKSLDAAEVSLQAGDEATYLNAAYSDASFTKPRNMVGLQKSLPAQDMKKLLLTNAPVSSEGINTLAVLRASAVQAYLQTTVDKEQLFVVQAGASAAAVPKDAKPSRVDFVLK